MPRLIDVESRRRELAEATWRLVERDGLDAVSVRAVAREAGVSPGSLRHVFASQAALLTFAMAALGERVAERLEALPPAATPLEGTLAVLAQLLPLDPERRREAEVWLPFVVKARVDPELRPVGRRADETLRRLVQMALAPLSLGNSEAAVEEVYALLDGLTLHAVLSGKPNPETMRGVLRAHLERLAES